MSHKTAYEVIPEHVLDRLTPTQQIALKRALGNYFKKQHSVDIRGTVPFPFLPKRFYFVFLGGIDKRSLSRGEIAMQLSSILILCLSFIFLSTLLGLVTIYLIKSFLGIDLLEGFSLGLWSFFTS